MLWTDELPLNVVEKKFIQSRIRISITVKPRFNVTQLASSIRAIVWLKIKVSLYQITAHREAWDWLQSWLVCPAIIRLCWCTRYIIGDHWTRANHDQNRSQMGGKWGIIRFIFIEIKIKIKNKTQDGNIPYVEDLSFYTV